MSKFTRAALAVIALSSLGLSACVSTVAGMAVGATTAVAVGTVEGAGKVATTTVKTAGKVAGAVIPGGGDDDED